VYINQIPEALFLLVYENNTLVRQQYVPTLKQYASNTIPLDEPLKVDETKDLRVAVYVEHNEITVPLGGAQRDHRAAGLRPRSGTQRARRPLLF